MHTNVNIFGGLNITTIGGHNEISPRQAAEYHPIRISLILIAASCGELNPGEIKFFNIETLPHRRCLIIRRKL
jgi:hypothetical protein